MSASAVLTSLRSSAACTAVGQITAPVLSTNGVPVVPGIRIAIVVTIAASLWSMDGYDHVLFHSSSWRSDSQRLDDPIADLGSLTAIRAELLAHTPAFVSP